MSTFTLSPTDNNYLTSSLVYKNLIQQSIPLVLNETNVIAHEDAVPTLHLDGQGRAYLTGRVSLLHASPTPAGMELFSLPDNIPLLTDVSLFPVVEFDNSSYKFNCLSLFDGTNAIVSVTVNTAGSYTGLPAVETTDPGVGFIGTARMKEVSTTVSVGQSGSGSYVPGDTFALVGGTVISGHAVAGTITHTKVISATVNAAGTGGVDGSAIVGGTTGTGVKFTANVTISGGGITAVNSISNAGNYTVNPTDITQEPVTGASLTGAKLSVKMGALTLTISDAGQYSVLPTAPYTTTTSGSGTGLRLTILWGVHDVAVTNGGFGYTPASTIVFVGGGQITPATASIVLSTNPDSPVGELANVSAITNVISFDGVTFLTGSY